jgi:CHASE3 domain sensor protein
MEKNAKQALQVTALILLVVLGVLAVNGFFLQRLVSQSFRTSENVRVARTLAFSALKEQLDEETGVRGFAATGETLFLEPYHDGYAHLPATFEKLDAALTVLGLKTVQSDLTDARATNATWLRTVATPLLQPHAKNSNAVERLGKRFVDRYRDDIGRVNDALEVLVQHANRTASASIARVTAFVAATIVVIIAFAIVFFTVQTRLVKRLEFARLRAEEQRRRTAELRASYQAEKRIADTLQEAFSQRPLPTVPSLHFSANYVPATEETKVGGDWYDALELPEGRVLFAIGDVAGHGIDAAVTMNRARQALISSALLDAEPAAVLARVNADMLRDKAPMVTAVAGFADVKQYEFVYASAGHPPPVLLEPGRPARMLEFGSLPLGVSADAAYRTRRVQTVPGAMLVLYTDGALEHSRNVLEGEELLLEATTQAGGSSEVDAASIIHNAIFSGRAVGDDVAILTIGFSSDPASGVTFSADNAQAAFGGRIARTPHSRLERRLAGLVAAGTLPKELAS